jgi:methanethiol S-methyltransferase
MASTRQPTRPQPTGRRPARGVPALLILGYAAAVYVLFLAVLGYAIGFFADAGVPTGMDKGTPSAWPLAMAADLLLLLLFAVQHSVMARPWFKRRWARLLPAPAERSTFVLCASLLLALLFWQWRPVGGMVWHLSGPAAVVVLGGYAIGWAVAVGSTFMIDHLDLFGLRQAYLHARGAAYRPPAFTERALYRWVRHPLMAGFVIVFWAAGNTRRWSRIRSGRTGDGSSSAAAPSRRSRATGGRGAWSCSSSPALGTPGAGTGRRSTPSRWRSATVPRPANSCWSRERRSTVAGV